MKPLKILLVEDEPHKKLRLLQAIKENLDLFDEPDTADSVARALMLLSTKRYDLLLADLILPIQYRGEVSEENGLELLRSIAQYGRDCGASYTVSITRAVTLSAATQRFFQGRPWGLLHYQDDTTEFLGNLLSIASYILGAKAEEAKGTPSVDALILTALPDPEFTAVVKQFPGLGPVRPLDVRQYYQIGELTTSDGQTISLAVAHCERMGPVHAAVSTAKLCQALRPKLVVMAGICAGFPKKAVLGDVIAAETSWMWQDGKFSVVNEEPTFQGSPHQVHVSPEVKHCVLTMKQDEAFWSSFTSLARNAGLVPPKLVCGPVATSTAVLADATVRDSIMESQHRAVVGLDMETYSVYAAAEAASSVQHFASLKAVCDGGDKGKEDAHQAYAATISAVTVVEFLKRFCAS